MHFVNLGGPAPAGFGFAAAPAAWPAMLSFFHRPMELRIDVDLREDEVDAELARLHRRIGACGFAQRDIPGLSAQFPGLSFRYREADGEHYVYVVDAARGRLAGYTVFNRLVELDRRADRHLRAPHSKYAAAYRRMGLASAIYQWALAAGWCLISGVRQSPGAHGLWRALSRRHGLCHVELRAKRLRLLGAEVSAELLHDFHTRLVLLGAGWTLDRFTAATGCRHDEAVAG